MPSISPPSTVVRVGSVVVAIGAVGFLAVALRGPVPHGQMPLEVELSYIDTTCAPCEDFYRHANGAWLSTSVIPEDRAAVGAQADLTARTEAVVRGILDSLAYAPERHARNATERKLGVFFATCMDTTIKGADELRAIEPELRWMGSVASRRDLGVATARLHLLRRWSIFDVFEASDERDPEITLGLIRQTRGAFFLPTAAHYLSQDSSVRRIRRAYSDMLGHVFEVLGDSPAAARANAARVMELESAFAELQSAMDREEEDQPGPTLTVSELSARTPSIDWLAYFTEVGRPDMPAVRVGQERFLEALERVAAATPWSTWQPYLQWQFLIANPGVNAFDGVIGAFRGSLGGAPQAPPLDVQCVRMVNNSLGMAVGEAYTAREFSAEARSEAVALTEQLRDALRTRIGTLDWLGAATKERVIAKLDAITFQIGYPDRWPDYGALEVVDGSFALNRIAATRLTEKEWFATLGVRPEAIPWQDFPASPWAGYVGSTNVVSITAAQLQPPFFDPDATDLSNLAGIGAIIGHELTHAFDSDDRLLDERGVRSDWWTPEEVASYEERARSIVAQYDRYVVIDTIRQDGRRTLGENISDIGGLQIAYLAFRRAMDESPTPSVDGYTAEQRFFLAFAQAKRSLERPADMRGAVEDTHSVAQWRVNGPLSRMPEFASAFGCILGEPMVLEDGRAGSIW